MKSLEEIKAEIKKLQEEGQDIFERIQTEEYSRNKAFLDYKIAEIRAKQDALKWAIS